MKKFYSLFLLTFIGLGVYAQPAGRMLTLRNIANCNTTGCLWSTAGNWRWDNNGTITTSARVPGDGDTIVIPTGLKVTVNANVGASGAGAVKNVVLRLFGTMELTGGTKMYLDANSVIAGAPGSSEILGNAGTSIWVGTSEISGATTKTGPFLHKTDPYGFNNSPNAAELSYTLPVKLTSFTATTSNAFVNLNWETAQESNNKHFELQRSANGQDWSTITTVAGKGTTYTVSNYTYTDKTPSNGNSFYRLKQVDFDNKYEISKVVAVKLSSIGSLSFDIMPNMVVNNFKVVASTDLRTADISIFNTVGNRMNPIINKNGNEANVNVTALSAGQYLLKIQSGSETLTKRFVIFK